MELNKSPSAKKTDHVSVATSDEQYPSLSQSQSRTYDCNFCKGGFSNARALGGHMNIHRKDKAKLKQSVPVRGGFSSAQALGGHMNIHRKDKDKLKQSIPVTESHQQQFLENTKTTLSPAYNLVHPTISTNPERRAASADNWIWNYNIEETDTTDQCFAGEPEQLPLFNKTTFKVEDQDQQHSQEESSSSVSHRADFDLELRLGHEITSDSSSPAKDTRKFL